MSNNMESPITKFNPDYRVDLNQLRRFGALSYFKIQRKTGPKFSKIAKRAILIGYKSDGYILFCPEEGKYYESRDVKFNEKQVFGDKYSKSQIKNWEVIDKEIDKENWLIKFDEMIEINKETLQTEEEPKRKRGRPRKVKSTAEEQEEIEEKDKESEKGKINALMARLNEDQISYREAMSTTERDQWEMAVKEELKSMEENEVWKLVERPKIINGKRPNIIDSKWVLKKKCDTDNKLKYKARLVIRGFKDRNYYDLSETYAPVSRLSLIRSVLAYANRYDLEMCQLDVKTAFLNGSIEEEIYMEIPEGIDCSKEIRNSKVCKLQRALYGLKISPKKWNEKFTEAAKEIGLENHDREPCLFTKISANKIIILLLYVDDMLIVSNNRDELVEIKMKLKQKFKMTDLGEPQSFLGMKIDRKREDRILKLTLNKYIEGLLEKFGYSEMHPQKTPMVTNKVNNRERREREDEETEGKIPIATNTQIARYRGLVGSLLYLSNTVRPDITYAVNVLSRHQINPTENEWQMAKRVCRYLKQTRTLGLTFRGETNELDVYSDASFADCKGSKTTGGFLIRLYGDIVAWKTHKQHFVSISTCQAEFVAMSEACQETVSLLSSLKLFIRKDFTPVDLYCDNVAVVLSTKTSVSNKLRHITEVREDYVRECEKRKLVTVKWVPFKEQLADIFTKALPLESHGRLTSKIMNIDKDTRKTK